jgi:hypothetical protein
MLTRQCTLAVLLCLALPSWGFGQTPTTASPDHDRIDALVRKLGSSSFLQREQARKELEAIGTPALEPLRRAKKTTDTEANRRIDELIRLFEEQTLTRQILTPKQVHLKLDGVNVQQAIASLANLSGYPIQLQGDATVFADRKITLDTGKTSFWSALDQLCEQAGLMEPFDLSELALLTNKGGRRYPQPPAPAGPVVLVNRSNEKSLVSYAGAVKTKVRISREAGTKELILLFIISAEPRLRNNTLVGRPIIDKTLADRNRTLQAILDMPKGAAKTHEDTLAELEQAMMGLEHPKRRFTQIRLKDAERAAKQLKELAGKLTLQVDLQNETLARIDNVVDAAGKSATGANGGTLRVQSVKKLAGGDIEMQVSMENLTANPFGGNVIINGGAVIIRGNVNVRGMIIGPNGVRMNGGGNQGDLPDLLDAKGQKYKVAAVTGDSFSFVNGSASRTATIVYHPSAGQAEPRELVLFGTWTHTIAVPFRFENVPLP